MTETTVQPAYTLKPGTRIRLGGGEFILRDVRPYGEWVELFFTTQRWDPYTERWTTKFGCHFGFCIEVIEK